MPTRSRPTLLLIDDDERLGESLKRYFDRYDLELVTATLPSAGLSRLARGDIDLLILDVMLPERDGYDVCREVRRTSELPILMLTARGEPMDRVVGLELLTTVGIGLAAGAGLVADQAALLDVSLVLALVAFLATLAYARVLPPRP